MPFGGISKRMIWDEYLKEEGFSEKEQKLLEGFLKKHEGMSGFEYQDKYYESFPIKFSLRAWGDLMSAWLNSKEGERKYNYIDFAW